MFKRLNWKAILSGIILVAVVAGVIGLVVALTGSETTKIGSSNFAVGAVNDDGVYEKSNTSVYTKNVIPCQGLTIDPDFEATGTYQVFYYGENKNFIGATSVINSEDGIYKKGNTFPTAKYCRIMITPDAPLDEEGNEQKDFKIRFYEVGGVVGDYDITVSKNQNYSFESSLKNLDDVCEVLGMGIYNTELATFEAGTSPFYFFDEVDTSNATQLVFKVKNSTLNASETYAGGSFKFPSIYNAATGGYLENAHYDILEAGEEFSYISYDVSSYSSIIGFVDVNSIDTLEIYVI
jgi:hypothetical protein